MIFSPISSVVHSHSSQPGATTECTTTYHKVFPVTIGTHFTSDRTHADLGGVNQATSGRSIGRCRESRKMLSRQRDTVEVGNDDRQTGKLCERNNAPLMSDKILMAGRPRTSWAMAGGCLPY